MNCHLLDNRLEIKVKPYLPLAYEKPAWIWREICCTSRLVKKLGAVGPNRLDTCHWTASVNASRMLLCVSRPQGETQNLLICTFPNITEGLLSRPNGTSYKQHTVKTSVYTIQHIRVGVKFSSNV